MTIDVLVPDSDDSGWTGGGTFADIDNGISTPSGVALAASVTGGQEIVLLGFTDSVVTDGDTVTTVTLKARARTVSSQNDSLRAHLRIGGVLQGSAVDISLGASYATLSFNDVGWNSDWTAAELDGMTWDITSRQAGMPGDRGHEIDEIEVEIDYTSGGGGQTIAVNTAIETDTAQIVVPDLPAAGQSIAVNTAIETDTAQSLQHRVIPLLAIETDSAQVIVPDDGASAQFIAVNTAIETNTSLGLNARLILNLATETDTAQVVGPAVIITVGLAVETDTGLKLDPLLIIGLASESDTAFVVNPDIVAPQFITPGIAIEVDTGLVIDALQILNRAEEADTALTVVPALSVSALLGIATDTETAQLMTPVLTLGLAVETDTGFLTTPILTLGRAAEADTAVGITPKLILQIASEADTALSINPAQNIELVLGVAIETDTALVVNPDLTIITFGAKYNLFESFPTGQSDVTVTLYDPITGNSVALDDTECKEIGNTGMYIWGNDKLTVQPIGYKEYLYQMTDGATTVDGKFVMPQYELVQHYKGLTAYG